MDQKFLVVCNAYPSEDNIYRNGFIHRRIKAYQEKGKEVEVFYLHPNTYSAREYEYDGVSVTMGHRGHFEEFLNERYDFSAFLIHFVNPDMYYPIVNIIDDPKIIIWIHGFEAENWHRRWFNFLNTPQELKKVLNQAKEYFPNQLEFMNEIYKQDEFDITFVHVSKWFKEHIADVDAKAAPKKYEIIPNIVDGSLFNYLEKAPTQRMKVLSIRPFASKKYANDQSVEAIIELSKKPFFKYLEFHFYGDGPLFNETMHPLKKFNNVYITKGFLKQNEISVLHKEFGVFLCPTRLDSQGVSMCEAMSSGVVPVSSNITAIPEFVEHNYSGLLAEPESPSSLAYQIERLYFNEFLFNRLSFNAATSIRKKADVEVVIDKELEVITGGR